MSEPYRRSNYLLDRPFQLKYTGALVALSLVVAAPFGFLLYRELQEAIQLGNEASEAAKTAAGQVTLLNRRLEAETLLKYKDDPMTQEASRVANAKAQKETDALTTRIAGQQAELGKKGARLTLMLGGAMALFLVVLAALGIFFTHKVAGPVHRMRQLFREVGEGRFSPYRPLREGDELQSFFTEFSAMVEKLRERQQVEIQHLGEALEKASKAGVSDASLAELRAVKDTMEKAVAPLEKRA